MAYSWYVKAQSPPKPATHAHTQGFFLRAVLTGAAVALNDTLAVSHPSLNRTHMSPGHWTVQDVCHWTSWLKTII